MTFQDHVTQNATNSVIPYSRNLASFQYIIEFNTLKREITIMQQQDIWHYTFSLSVGRFLQMFFFYIWLCCWQGGGSYKCCSNPLHSPRGRQEISIWRAHTPETIKCLPLWFEMVVPVTSWWGCSPQRHTQPWELPRPSQWRLLMRGSSLACDCMNSLTALSLDLVNIPSLQATHLKITEDIDLCFPAMVSPFCPFNIIPLLQRPSFFNFFLLDIPLFIFLLEIHRS